ncbi:hypothetical protein [Fervidobacterium sp.]
MKRTEMLLGVALLLLGLLFLLERMDWAAARTLWGGGMALAGGAFLLAGVQGRDRFWLVIPGAALLGLGLGAWRGGDLGGAFFLGFTGLGFLLVFALRATEWWALIPGGVLLSLALVALVEALWPGVEAGWALFLGLSATFGVLFALGHRWALWPALGLLAPLVLALQGVGEVLSYLFPLLLVILGAWLLFRGFSGRA